jgi:hypothetical protein
MRRLYERTDGELLEEIPQETLANDLGWDLKTTSRVFDYLINEGLAECPSYGGGASITHEGVREVERALTEPDQPTEHFPPAVTVHFHGNVVGSQVQAGTVRSGQHQVSAEIDRGCALQVVSELRNVLADGRVDPAVRVQGQASLVAVEAQLNLEMPNAGFAPRRAPNTPCDRGKSRCLRNLDRWRRGARATPAVLVRPRKDDGAEGPDRFVLVVSRLEPRLHERKVRTGPIGNSSMRRSRPIGGVAG